MEDSEIVRLYFARSEQALVETQAKYGAYCYSIAYNILANSQDAEECVSDTYLAAWNRIPPKKPDYLGAFLGRITRYLSIDRWRSRRSQKRGGGEIALAALSISAYAAIQARMRMELTQSGEQTIRRETREFFQTYCRKGMP